MTPAQLRAALKAKAQPKLAARTLAKHASVSQRLIPERAVIALVQSKIDALVQRLNDGVDRDTTVAKIAALRTVITDLASIETDA